MDWISRVQFGIFVINFCQIGGFSWAANMECPNESLMGPENLPIKWESSKNSIVISVPGCLDSENRYILRMCQDGVWNSKEPPLCYKISLSSTACDPGLISLDRYCALVTFPQPYDDQCPPGFLKYYNFTRFDPSFSFWSPIRKVDNLFIYTGSDVMYGKEFIASNQKSDCYINSKGTTLPRFCNETHPQLCIRTPTNPMLQVDKELAVNLKFDQRRGKLVLNLYTPGNVLRKLDGPDDAIYCFTNADEVEIKSPLKIKSVKSKKDLHVYQIAIKYDHPGEYWCDVFDFKQNLIKSNSLIAYKKKRGHEYSLRIILMGICRNMEQARLTTEEICTIVDGKLINKFLDEIQFNRWFYNVDMVTRVMKIFAVTGENVDVILHISTLRNTNIIGEYFKLKSFVEKISGIHVIWFRSSDYCLPETSDRNGLSWGLTRISKHTLPNQICLDNRKLPYKRKCLGSFIEGAFWEDFLDTCKTDSEISENTEQLYNISMSEEFSPSALVQIKAITTDDLNIIPLDVFLIANTLQNVIGQPTSQFEILDTVMVDSIVQTIENIMVFNETILKEAQIELNATDSLLDSIDKLFGEETPLLKDAMFAKLNAGEVYTMVKSNFIVHITKPFVSNINGIGVFGIPNLNGSNDTIEDGFSENSIVSMHLDQTFNDLTNLENLDLATHVPLKLLEAIAIKNGNSENITIITTIFYNDKFFNSKNEDLGIPQGKIVSVKIPDFGFYLDEPLPILFRVNSSEINSTCAYWQYGEYAPNKSGQWSTLGGELELSDNFTNFTQCYFNHLTHFALLIMGRSIFVPDDPEHTDIDTVTSPPDDPHQYILEVITIAGCIASLFGILGIFLTAICFQRWRQKTGIKILLQLSLIIMLELVVVHVSGIEKLSQKPFWCNIVGMCLHYIVLAKSSWMFVSAILQYLRFVKIFQVLPNRLILKSMIFAWGVPLIPVVLVYGLMPNGYNVGSQKFCYPSGLGLYLGVFAPVVLIVLCNLIVFILIMKNVFNPHVEVKLRSCKSTSVQNKLQIYLGILLFFMLGVPWVFGILGEVLTYPFQLIFVYLFCLTATLQGCVIFVFYVIVDKDTRLLWIKFFRRHFGKTTSK